MGKPVGVQPDTHTHTPPNTRTPTKGTGLLMGTQNKTRTRTHSGYTPKGTGSGWCEMVR
jgi:hypothetical protein